MRKRLKALVVLGMAVLITISTPITCLADYYSTTGNPIPDFTKDYVVTNPVPGAAGGSPYGMRQGKWHKGIDIGTGGTVGEPSLPVYPMTPGTVVTVRYKEPQFCGYRVVLGISSPWYDGYEATGRGNYVIVEHGSSNGYKVTSLYAHLWDVNVKEGDYVTHSTMLGHSGSTGNSTCNHLHFEIRANNNQLNPALIVSFPPPSNESYWATDFGVFSGLNTLQPEVEGLSFHGDLVNKVFDISLSDGTDFFNPEWNIKRKDYNKKIFQTPDVAPQISLFDRFGPDIQFIPYFGEKKFELSLLDTFYENIKDNNGEFKFAINDLWKNRSGVLLNEVYDGRPEIVSESERESGYEDPRRDHYTGLSITGANAAIGNFYLKVGILFTKLVSFLGSNRIFELMNSVWETVVNNGIWEELSKNILLLVPIIMIPFIIYLTKLIIQYNSGKKTSRAVWPNIVNYFATLFLVAFLLGAPNAFGDLFKTLLTQIDDLFAYALNQNANEVSKSSDLDNVYEATLWSKSVFDPWCKGMFDKRGYDELYTMYDQNPDHKKLIQSNENITEQWPEGEYRRNSKYVTGDIQIPIGGGEIVRNWGALAWSTQSIYHIDAVPNQFTYMQTGESWPLSQLTPKNPSIYVDNFRWLDAKLNISPEFASDSTYNNNYPVGDGDTDAHKYSDGFIVYGFEALFMSFLLAPLLYPIMKRLISLMLIILISGRLMLRSIICLFKPGDNEYHLLANIKKILKPLYHYFWWSLVSFIFAILYLTLTGKFLSNILYIGICLVLMKIAKPINNFREIRDAKNFISEKYKHGKEYVKNRMEKFKA